MNYFSYKLVCMTLFNKSRSHYTAALLQIDRGFTTAAHLKPHTLNRWQTCYLNWKFNMLSILDIDIKPFLKMEFILALQAWNNLLYVCIVNHMSSKHALERQELFVYQNIFVGIILLKMLREF